MYNRHFGLETSPFRITPDTRRFFGGSERAAILDTLKYAILTGEGMIKVTGEVGTGKTMLCRMLQDQLPDEVTLVYLANPSLSRDEILRAIALELGLPIRDDSRHFEQLQTLQAFLLSEHRAGRRVVVFIEEAQCMPLETLEEIRLLSNLETRQDKLMQLVLFGQPELDQLLARNELRQLRDRITHSLELRPLNANDVRDYVRFRLHSAGLRGGDPFTPAAYRLLTRTSKGLIRRIHVLADKALLAAYAERSPRVMRRHMRLAINDSEFGRQLRLPWPFGRARLPAPLAAGMVLTALAVPVFLGVNGGTPAPATGQQATTSQNFDKNRLLAVKPAAGAPLVSQRLSASREWLARPPAGHLTIQVLLTDNDDPMALEQLLKRPELQPFLDNLYLKESEVDGRRRWSVFFGEFADKSSAGAAIGRLPAVLRAHQPYLRSLRSLREAFRNTAGA